MFVELSPLLRQRSVVLILTRQDDDKICVNVIPKKLNESENDALTTPLALINTAEALDAELPTALSQFVGSNLELKNNLESAKEAMAAEAKRVREEAKAKKPNSTPSAKPLAKAVEKKEDQSPSAQPAKTPEPKKPAPPMTGGLFDFMAAAPVSTPPPPVAAKTAAPTELAEASGDDDEDILAEIAEAGEGNESDEPDEDDVAA